MAQEGAGELYLQELKLSEIALNITLQMDPLCQPATLQPYHPIQLLLGVRFGAAMLSVSGWKLELPAYQLLEAFETAETLTGRVALHYIRPLLQASYRLLSQLISLNPMQLIDDVIGSLRVFVRESREGLRARDPIAAASGIAKGTVASWEVDLAAQLRGHRLVARVCGKLERAGLADGAHTNPSRAACDLPYAPQRVAR